MPTSYVGLKTNTQAPSAKPKPEGTVTVALPADGDPPNASTFAQMGKVLADNVDFLLKPQAEAAPAYNSPIWGYPIHTYRSAAGHRRFAIDHNGLPAGQFYGWQETWPATYTTQTMSGTGYAQLGNLGDWAVTATRASTGTASVATKVPSTDWSQSRYLEMTVSDTAGDAIQIQRGQEARFYDDNIVIMEWMLQVTNNTAESTITMGFNAAPGEPFSSRIQFFTVAGSPWQCQVGNDAGTGPQVAALVTPDGSWQRFRIEWHGVNADEGAAKRALFFINGALQANLNSVDNPTGSFPDGGGYPMVTPFFRLERASAGSAKTVRVSPVRYQATLWLDAVI